MPVAFHVVEKYIVLSQSLLSTAFDTLSLWVFFPLMRKKKMKKQESVNANLLLFLISLVIKFSSQNKRWREDERMRGWGERGWEEVFFSSLNNLIISSFPQVVGQCVDYWEVANLIFKREQWAKGDQEGKNERQSIKKQGSQVNG